MGGTIRGRLFSNITVFNGLGFERGQSLMVDCNGKASYKPTPDVEASMVATLQEIDGTGLTVTPTFHDTHTHLLSYAANLLAYDIGLGDLSKEVFISLVRKAAKDQREADVVRVNGMDHHFANVGGQLQVDHALLDEALPDRPLRIQTRSGHAHVLNSVAMHLAGIVDSTDEPDGVTFERRLSDGRLNGVFLEAGAYLDDRLPVIGQSELKKGVERALDTIHANGINDLTDATHINDIARYELLSECLKEYAPYMRLLFMPGFDALRHFVDLGMTYKSQQNGILLGPIKIMLTGSSGSIYPDNTTLKETIRECHRFGFPVAIHSVDMDSTDSVIEALSDDFVTGDRIEHASELRDDQIHRMSEISLNVSTQPSFIYERGDGYLNSDAASRIDKLYRLKSLLSAGIVVGASSDCPVTDPDPMKTIYSSVARRTSTGATVNIEERVTVCEALKMLTTNSVTISGLSEVRDWTDKNLILIDNDLDSCSDEELLEANISWISDFE